MRNYKPGEKVVCVNGTFDISQPHFYEIFHQLPLKNKTYTVRLQEGNRLLLEEVRNPECPFDLAGITVWDEPGFDVIRFRPLEEMLRSLTEENTRQQPEKYNEPIPETEIEELIVR